MKYQNSKMETKQKLKVGDKIECITDIYNDFTKGKEYIIEEINTQDFTLTLIDDFKDENDFTLMNFDKYFKIKEEKEIAYKETKGKLFYELDFDFITKMAERMASNKGKYEPYNWQKLDNVEELKQALFRHVLEVMKGNLEDDGRDFGHLEAIACDVMMIYYQLKKNRQKITK